MHQESQKISVPYNGILPINIKQVPQYSPIPVDTLVECHVWNHWTRSSVPTATTIPWNVGELIVGRSEPVWSLTASVCVSLPLQWYSMVSGNLVQWSQRPKQGIKFFYFQWIIQCSQSSDFFSVIITPAFLIFFFQSKLPEEIKQGKCHLELHLHMKHFPKYKARWSKSEL